MSKLNKARGLALLTLGLSAAVGTQPLAVRQAALLGNQAKQAHDFLVTAYPELPPKDSMRITIEQDVGEPWNQAYGASFEISPLSTIGEANANGEIELDPQTGHRVPPPLNTPILVGSIGFTNSRITNFSASGEVTNEKKNNSIEQAIESHPEWSGVADYDALKKAGARFGPEDREAFLATINIPRYERFLGKLTIRSVSFAGPQQEHIGSFGAMSWSITVEARPPGEKPETYVFMFEPFDGKLFGLSRMDAPPAKSAGINLK